MYKIYTNVQHLAIHLNAYISYGCLRRMSSVNMLVCTYLEQHGRLSVSLVEEPYKRAPKVNIHIVHTCFGCSAFKGQGIHNMVLGI